MDWLQAIVLGFVEGLTEFLPISSTGHLIIVADWLGLPQNAENKAFEVIIQLAAILAVVTLYQDKIRLEKWRLWFKLFIAFLPVAVVGLLFSHQIKALFSVQIVAWMFIIGGVVFLLIERWYPKQPEANRVYDVEKTTFKQAFWIGIAQVFALIPGTSRAGSTIVGALLVGLSRKAAAEFSFLLALPVMAAASGYDLLKHYEDFSQTSWLPLILGFIVAYIVAYGVMKLFIAFLQRFTFNAFGIYRIIFGLALLWFYS